MERRLRHFVGARLIGRGVGGPISGFHQTIGEEIRFDFLTANIGEHTAIDFDARTKHLAALFDHFLPLQGIVDDVAVFVGQVVFAHNRAYTLAPATARFEISNDFWFIHGKQIR